MVRMRQCWLIGSAAAMAASAVPAAAAAQAGTAAKIVRASVQTPAEALAQDAVGYAARYRLTPDEAIVRLRALQASAAFTDRIRETFRDRLVGISIDHAPALRIVVLLTGTAAVADSSIAVEGMVLPVIFRTGASVTGDDVIRAMLQRGRELNALMPNCLLYTSPSPRDS